MGGFVQVTPESFNPPKLPIDIMYPQTMAAAYWWRLSRLHVGPLSPKQRLRRCCRLKGSLSMESHSIAIHVNGTRIVADVEPRVLLVHFLREQRATR
jgi:hypothetical protein